ncbi:MAG: hypothetical protein J6Q84_00865 [Kiritimatiellae bacterium]|nr:hypothetical protein [Kiritimatiellia bacterium]
MKTISIMFTSLFACALVIAARAQSAERLVDVVATGYGSTPREATKAALRSAVESVVGTMVDATTLVENDKLIEDEILTYSAGMIAATKIIGEPKKSSDGLYTVKVKATVKKSDLKEKLKAASTVNVALDGNDLFARMTAEKEKLSNAEAIIRSVLAKHTSCVVVEEIPGENGKSSIDLDPKTGEVFVNVRARIDKVKYEQFANEVVEKIGAIIGTEKVKVRPDEIYNDGRPAKFNIGTLREYSFFIITKIRNSQAIAFKDERQITNVMDIINSYWYEIGHVALSITLRDVLGEELYETYVLLKNKKLEYGYSGEMSNFSVFGKLNSNRTFAVLPYLTAFDYGGYTKIESDKTFRVSMGKFTPEELKSVAKIEFKVGFLKDGKFTE